jgi:hypothetical protein
MRQKAMRYKDHFGITTHGFTAGLDCIVLVVYLVNDDVLPVTMRISLGKKANDFKLRLETTYMGLRIAFDEGAVFKLIKLAVYSKISVLVRF